MNTLVEVIQRTGIFLIAAQALIHFAPGTAYAKYMKLLMGIMVLLLLLSPVHQIITDDILSLQGMTDRYEMSDESPQTSEFTMSWAEMESYIENHTWKQENALNQLEMEIKSRLDEKVGKMFVEEKYDVQEENKEYSVASVTINETKPLSLRVVMYGKSSDNDVDDASIIQIPDIVIGKNEQNKEDITPNNITYDIENNGTDDRENTVAGNRKLNEYFEQSFADILGVEPEQVEVIIYGAY